MPAKGKWHVIRRWKG